MIKIPDSYNYIAAFLTLRCNLSCSYCINTPLLTRKEVCKGYKEMSGKKWLEALSRIEARNDLPITLQGGEPTLHRDFYEIVNKLNKPIDLLTNLQFNIDEFIKEVPPKVFNRKAPYASIRVSYHPETMNLQRTVFNVKTLKESGYNIGVWMIEFPDKWQELLQARWMFTKLAGVDFRVKALLGQYKGELYGTYKYKDATNLPKSKYKEVLCRPSELIIAPDGTIHRCHSDLYNLRKGIDSILESPILSNNYRDCSYYGSCSGCDIKIKNNRFQEFGHTSVDIQDGAISDS